MTFAFAMLGRWDEALARLEEIPDDQLGSTQMSVCCRAWSISTSHRGELDAARQLLARYEEVGRTIDVQSQNAYLASTAAIRLAEGNPREALVAAERAFEHRATLGFASQDVKRAFRLALEAALALGERGQGGGAARARREPAARAPTAAPRRRSAGASARVSPATIRAAETDYTAAVEGMRELDLSFHLAVVALEYGEWLAAQGRTDEAEPLVAEAREIFERLGAVAWMERAAQLPSSGRTGEPVAARS